jgi:hypothetical protein
MGVPILEEILTFLQNVVTWFVNVIPSWAKIIMSLFFVMFLANWFVPVILGFNYGCSSTNNLYRMGNPLTGFEVMSQKWFTNLDTNTSINYTDVINRTIDQKSFTDWVIRFVPCYFGRNSTECSLGAFDYWRYQYPDNYTETTIADYDALVLSGGSYEYHGTEGRDIFELKCSDLQPRIFLFGSVDLFDPTLWLIITVITFLIPLALKWYEVMHVF